MDLYEIVRILTDQKGEIQIAQIVVDRTAAGHTADNGDTQLPQGLHMDFPADVLITAHNDGGTILPQKKDVLIPEVLKDELLKGLIIEGIMGVRQCSQHEVVISFNESNPNFTIAIRKMIVNKRST